MRPKRSKYQIARFTVFHGGPPFLKARIPNNVRFFAVHHQICLVRRDSCIHCVGAQFLFPIETVILGGDNRILDFDTDTGAMDFSLVRYVARSVQSGRVEWVPEPRLSRPGHERSVIAAGRPYAAPSIRKMFERCGPASSTALEVDMLISIRWRKLRF